MLGLFAGLKAQLTALILTNSDSKGGQGGLSLEFH